MKIYAICLDQEIDRKEAIAKNCEELNLNVEFISAVDGRSLNPKDSLMNWIADEQLAINMIGRPLGPGEIGCFLSHLKTWQAVIRSGEKNALVIESDALLTGVVPQILNDLEHIKVNYDLIMLHFTKCWPSFWGRINLRLSGHQLVRFANSRSYSTAAYVISNVGARKLFCFTKQYKVFIPPDDFMTGGRIKKDMNIFAAYPISVGLSEFAGNSTIEADRSGKNEFQGHRIKNRTGLKKIGESVRKFKSKIRKKRQFL